MKADGKGLQRMGKYKLEMRVIDIMKDGTLKEFKHVAQPFLKIIYCVWVDRGKQINPHNKRKHL